MLGLTGKTYHLPLSCFFSRSEDCEASDIRTMVALTSEDKAKRKKGFQADGSCLEYRIPTWDSTQGGVTGAPAVSWFASHNLLFGQLLSFVVQVHPNSFSPRWPRFTRSKFVYSATRASASPVLSSVLFTIHLRLEMSLLSAHPFLPRRLSLVTRQSNLIFGTQVSCI